MVKILSIILEDATTNVNSAIIVRGKENVLADIDKNGR